MRTGSAICLWPAILSIGLMLTACSDDADKKAVGDLCANNNDCQDEICHVGVCASKNPAEVGEACSVDADCRSFNCKDGVCAPGTRPNGDHCRDNVECASGVCQIESPPLGLCVKGALDPDGAVPDSAPDAAWPDAGPDAPLPDAPLPDKALPDKALPDKALPDKALPDQMWPDAPLPDYGPCGNKNEPCCGSICNAPLTCVSNTCVCGGKGQPCCTGAVCDANLTCHSTTKLCTCGAHLQPCCGGTSCNSTLFCAGEACTCIKDLDGDHYIRNDNTAWAQTDPTYVMPISVSGPLLQNVTQVMAGHYHGCALKSDGTVWCWGRSTSSCNNNGQIGNGTLGGATTGYNATQVKTSTGLLTSVIGISSSKGGGYGCSTTCAVKSDGTVWCWGAARSYIGYGLYQTSNGTDKPVATQIKASATAMLTGAKQVSLRYHHACAVVGNNAACWGKNTVGELGVGNTNSHLYPVLVSISGKAIKRVSAGRGFTCALTTTNEVYCWGDNSKGQCGQGYTSAAVTGPVAVTLVGGGNLTNVKELATGYNLACAIKTDNSLWCWGKLYNTTMTKATQMLDSASKPISAALVTTDRTVPDYRVLRTDGEYYRWKTKLYYSCP